MHPYTKRPATRSERVSRNDQWFSNLMIILTIIFLICAAFQYTHENFALFSTKPKWLSQNNLNALPAPQNTTPSKTNSTATKANEQPRYDFYKLLPEMSVTVTPEDDNKS